MNLIKTISSELNSAGQRVIKFLRYGKSDFRTARQVSSFGIDSTPLKDMIAVFSPTDERGKSVVIGYLNKSMVTGEGETRLYSLNSAGVLQTYVWLKTNGDILLGGDSKHLTRFEELETGFNQLKSDFNTHVHASNGVAPTVPSTASIATAKTDKIKTL